MIGTIIYHEHNLLNPFSNDHDIHFQFLLNRIHNIFYTCILTVHENHKTIKTHTKSVFLNQSHNSHNTTILRFLLYFQFFLTKQI